MTLLAQTSPAWAADTQEQTSRLLCQESLEDGSVLCTFYQDSQGQIVVEFRSESPHLQGGRVHVRAVSQQTQEEIWDKPVPLEPDDRGILTGRLNLSDALDLRQGYDITWELEPPIK